MAMRDILLDEFARVLYAPRIEEKRIRYKCGNCKAYLSDDEFVCKVCRAKLVDDYSFANKSLEMVE